MHLFMLYAILCIFFNCFNWIYNFPMPKSEISPNSKVLPHKIEFRSYHTSDTSSSKDNEKTVSPKNKTIRTAQEFKNYKNAKLHELVITLNENKTAQQTGKNIKTSLLREQNNNKNNEFKALKDVVPSKVNENKEEVETSPNKRKDNKRKNGKVQNASIYDAVRDKIHQNVTLENGNANQESRKSNENHRKSKTINRNATLNYTPELKIRADIVTPQQNGKNSNDESLKTIHAIVQENITHSNVDTVKDIVNPSESLTGTEDPILHKYKIYEKLLDDDIDVLKEDQDSSDVEDKLQNGDELPDLKSPLDDYDLVLNKTDPSFSSRLRKVDPAFVAFVIFLIAFTIFICVRACQDIFCGRRYYGGSTQSLVDPICCSICVSDVFVVQSLIRQNRAKPTRRTPPTPPPPYHLFAPPMYKDIVGVYTDVPTQTRNPPLYSCIPHVGNAQNPPVYSDVSSYIPNAPSRVPVFTGVPLNTSNLSLYTDEPSISNAQNLPVYSDIRTKSHLLNAPTFADTPLLSINSASNKNIGTQTCTDQQELFKTDTTVNDQEIRPDIENQSNKLVDIQQITVENNRDNLTPIIYLRHSISCVHPNELIAKNSKESSMKHSSSFTDKTKYAQNQLDAYSNNKDGQTNEIDHILNHLKPWNNDTPPWYATKNNQTSVEETRRFLDENKQFRTKLGNKIRNSVSFVNTNENSNCADSMKHSVSVPNRFNTESQEKLVHLLLNDELNNPNKDKTNIRVTNEINNEPLDNLLLDEQEHSNGIKADLSDTHNDLLNEQFKEQNGNMEEIPVHYTVKEPFVNVEDEIKHSVSVPNRINPKSNESFIDNNEEFSKEDDTNRRNIKDKPMKKPLENIFSDKIKHSESVPNKINSNSNNKTNTDLTNDVNFSDFFNSKTISEHKNMFGVGSNRDECSSTSSCEVKDGETEVNAQINGKKNIFYLDDE